MDVLDIDERQVIQSPIDYRKEDLAGPVLGLSGEAGVGLGIPLPHGQGVEITLFKASASGLVFMGSGLLPRLVIAKEPEPEGPGSEISPGEVEFKGGFESTLTATAGYVWDEGEALELLSAPVPVRFRPSQAVAVDAAVFF